MGSISTMEFGGSQRISTFLRLKYHNQELGMHAEVEREASEEKYLAY